LQNFRTDLALEMKEHINTDIEGVASFKKHYEEIEIDTVDILDELGAQKIKKPIGRYVTLSYPPECEYVSDALSKEISALLPNDLKTVLIAGLGNWNITPDALGPKVVGKLLVTRHLKDLEPKFYSDVLSVSAISPGVLGLTGIETGEIIKGICDKIKPQLVILIDALASKSTDRIGNTIQIANTGITPGSGIGNRRFPITKETLGTKVMSIGLPTVVDVFTVIYNTLEKLSLDADTEKFSDFFKKTDENMILSPKNIDLIIEENSKIISLAINMALHPSISKEELKLLS